MTSAPAAAPHIFSHATPAIFGEQQLWLERVPPSQWEGRLLPAWEDLLEKSVEPTIFLSPPWITSWWRYFQQGKQACMLAAWDQHGRLLGLAPMYLRQVDLAGFPNLLSLQLMSDVEVGSEYLGLLVVPGLEAEFTKIVSHELQGQWALSDFRGLREDGRLSRGLVEAFGIAAPERIYHERHACSLVPLPHDYETYLASLEQKFRSTIRYRTNKLTKNFAVRLVRTTHEHELGAHLERLFSMHQARWWAEGIAGCFYNPRKRAFYRDISAAFLRRGWLRFYHLEIDGIIRASQYGFAFGGIMHSLQESFDHEFCQRGVGGLGVVLRAMVLKEAISEGLKGYDFLGGTEDYKTRWNTLPHYTRRVRIGASGMKGAMAFCATAGVRKMKTWGKQRLPLWLSDSRNRLAVWAEYRRARKIAGNSKD